MTGLLTPSYNQEFLVDTVGLTVDYVSEIILACVATSEFNPEKEYFWNKKLTKLTADVSQFVEITTLLSKAVLKKNTLLLTDIKESHIQLLFIMKAMNQASDKRDYLALEDLIKYELKDNLTQWKIDLIPQIKMLLTT